MDRRTFLISGTLGSMGVTACGGGGSSGPVPTSAPTPPATLFATGWTQMPVETYQGLPQVGSANFSSDSSFAVYDLSDTHLLALAGWPTWLPGVEPTGQGRQPSCTAWAVGYAAATATMLAAGAQLTAPISPADLFAKMRRRSPDACRSGSMISYAMDTLVQEGATTLALAPYSDLQCGVASASPAFQLDGFSRVAASDISAIRGAIQATQPVSFGMLVDDRFNRLNPANAVYVPSGAGSGHAMSVIGYDDTSQRYKIMNSWGTGWGVGGMFWMAYGDFARFASDVCIPYLRRAADNALLASATSNPAVPIVPQFMRGTRYAENGGSYGAGVEMGWSAPLQLQSAALAVLDSNANVQFNQTIPVSQIARGLRFGAAIPVAFSNYVAMRSIVTGTDANGTPLTLTTFTRSSTR